MGKSPKEDLQLPAGYAEHEPFETWIVVLERIYALVLCLVITVFVILAAFVGVFRVIWPWNPAARAAVAGLLAVVPPLSQAWTLLIVLAVPIAYSPLRRSLFHAHKMLRNWGLGKRIAEGTSRRTPE